MSGTIKTLQQAVVDEITQGFVANQCEFSAHDVTVCLRKKINDGILELAGVAVEDVDGINTQRVSHEDVRFVVHDHCGNGICNIPGYERRWNPFTNGRPGGYFTWASLGTHTDDDDDDDDDDDGTIAQPAAPLSGVSIGTSIVAGFGTTATTPAPVPATPKAQTLSYPHANPDDPIVISKVVAYFTNQVKRGGVGTLHSAQRSLKRDPLTIAEIKQIATANGFLIDNQGGAECDSKVFVGGKTWSGFVASR